VKRRASAKCEEREASICRTEIGIERCSEGRDRAGQQSSYDFGHAKPPEPQVMGM
jgi:hypothetical protein